jgi:hypothetical protein
MKTTNKLDKYFGPTGTTAGITLFLAGLIITWFSWIGLVVILIGAFTAFTTTGTQIDFDLKRVRFTNSIFGIIQTGKWLQIDPEMKIGIEKANILWRAYSRGNQSLDINETDFRLILYNKNKKQLFPLKKLNSLEAAKTELHIMSEKFGIGTI